MPASYNQAEQLVDSRSCTQESFRYVPERILKELCKIRQIPLKRTRSKPTKSDYVDAILAAQEEHLLAVRKAKIQAEARTYCRDIQAGRLTQKDLERLSVNLLREISAVLAVNVTGTGNGGRALKKEVYVNAILLREHQPPTNSDKKDVSIDIQKFYTGGVSSLTGYKLETLREMCQHLGLTALATGKHGRIIRADYVKALLDSTVPSDNRTKMPSLDEAHISTSNILDIAAPAPPRVEVFAMEVQTAFVPAQLERVADDNRSKRKRIHSGEDKQDTMLSRATKKSKTADNRVATEAFGFAILPDTLGAAPMREAETIIVESKGTAQTVRAAATGALSANGAPNVDCAMDLLSGDVIMTRVEDIEMTEKKRKKEKLKSQEIPQVQVHVYQSIHDYQPSLSKTIECQAGIDLKLLSDELGMGEPCRVIDPANWQTCAYVNNHIPAEYLEYLYFDDHHGRHIRVTFNRRYNPKVKAYRGH